MSIENEIANTAKEYGYNFIKDSVFDGVYRITSYRDG